MTYYLFESVQGKSYIVDSFESRWHAISGEIALRETYTDRTTKDCYILSDAELRQIRESSEFYDSLTQEQKTDYVIIDGVKYIRAIYEKTH